MNETNKQKCAKSRRMRYRTILGHGTLWRPNCNNKL